MACKQQQWLGASLPAWGASSFIPQRLLGSPWPGPGSNHRGCPGVPGVLGWALVSPWNLCYPKVQTESRRTGGTSQSAIRNVGWKSTGVDDNGWGLTTSAAIDCVVQLMKTVFCNECTKETGIPLAMSLELTPTLLWLLLSPPGCVWHLCQAKGTKKHCTEQTSVHLPDLFSLLFDQSAVTTGSPGKKWDDEASLLANLWGSSEIWPFRRPSTESYQNRTTEISETSLPLMKF